MLAHFFGRANTASELLSRMQMDHCLGLHLKLNGLVPIREIENKTEAKASDVSL